MALNVAFTAINNAISFITWVIVGNPDVTKYHQSLASKRIDELREAKYKMLGD